ncbi:FAD:protein FMN transferase [Polynucleobacter sp. MWH-Aus1W21]|jgi:thiamine biosynthesis lipoprotein|uniref:FAD:protein FMN transferase n=1 Tax=Polynucleobacter sp. MWH-Aus1W21 TaxID=1855880 RepID=UPI001BFDE927|nr:FAD:protein FMN transferase [Polynucleobacter sp. MWH-Aus1W21]QWD66608.1 FAD:protein FMN transferase [Polynucleobacter sp. MWH-Aus1W21]
MIRCKPLLGTFVEISIDEDDGLMAIDYAFDAIQKVQDLMGFHNAQSELSLINQYSHAEAVEIHPWTAQVIRIAKEIYLASNGLFNCGIGHRLVAAGLLPRHITFSNHELGGIEDIEFLAPDLVKSVRPVCLDLGGIAKGFAVDMAVRVLISEGICSGSVNAGGDLRVFGNTSFPIQIRNPELPEELIEVGSLKDGAIATSSLYFAKRDGQISYIINPLAQHFSEVHAEVSGSFSILAKECIYADALTKVLALSNNENHPCFERFSAQALRIAA